MQSELSCFIQLLTKRAEQYQFETKSNNQILICKQHVVFR